MLKLQWISKEIMMQKTKGIHILQRQCLTCDNCSTHSYVYATAAVQTFALSQHLQCRLLDFRDNCQKGTFGALFSHLIGMMLITNCAPVPTPSSPDKALSAISVKVLCTKERDDIRPQTKNVRAQVVFGLYCRSSQNLIKEFFMKSRHIVKASLILFLVSLVSQ